MDESEINKRVRLVLMTIKLLPSKSGFEPLAVAIKLQTLYCLPMQKIYPLLWEKFHKTRSCLERGIRICLTDLDPDEFSRVVAKMTDYTIRIDMVKLTCHNFVGLMSEIIRIAYDIEPRPYPGNLPAVSPSEQGKIAEIASESIENADKTANNAV